MDFFKQLISGGGGMCIWDSASRMILLPFVSLCDYGRVLKTASSGGEFKIQQFERHSHKIKKTINKQSLY